MDLETQSGEKVRYIGWGRKGDWFLKEEKQAIAAGLIFGNTYTVKELDVGSSFSLVTLDEIPNQYFNPLMFQNVVES